MTTALWTRRVCGSASRSESPLWTSLPWPGEQAEHGRVAAYHRCASVLCPIVGDVSRIESPPSLFIGSSAEGHAIARNLQEELESQHICEVTRWDVNVFEPGGFTLESLLQKAREVDFAVLVATPDDMLESRGVQAPSMRDNVLLELGIFLGALGRERAYLLTAGDSDLRIPSDLLGLTRLPYRARSDNDIRLAVNGAVLQIEQQVKRRGPRKRSLSTPGQRTTGPRTPLDAELERLCENAVAQGWTVKANSQTTLRLRSPRGQVHTLQKRHPGTTREELREFAAQLRAAGLRVNSGIRGPVEESPF